MDIHYVEGELFKTVWIGTDRTSIALENLKELFIREIEEEE